MRGVLLLAAPLIVGCTTTGTPRFTVAGGADGPADASADASSDDASPSGPPDGLTWTAVPMPVQGGDILAIWGTSAADVYVGTDMNAIFRLDRGSWRTMPVASHVIGGGWGTDILNVYAVAASDWLGQSGAPSSQGLFRFDTNVSWYMVAPGTFYSVWGSSASDVYAVGPGGVLHASDGAAFQLESAAGGDVLHVWGSGPGDVFATASGSLGTILHSAGDGNWVSVFGPAPGRAWAGWSSGPGDAYVVLSPAQPGDPDAQVLHSAADGGWTPESTGQPGVELVALWGSGPHAVYVAGWHASAGGRTGDLFFSTGDGNWTRVVLPGSVYEVTSVWGTSASDVYVGEYDIDDGPTVLHGQP